MSRDTVYGAARRLGATGWAAREIADRGYGIELEHGRIDRRTDVTGNDMDATIKIALAHLKEFPDYYRRLERMEREGSAGLGGRPPPDPFEESVKRL